MPYTLEWLEKPHIVYLSLTGDVTEEEFSAWVDEAIAMADSVPGEMVHTLINLEGLTQFPSLAFLGHELKRLKVESPNRDMSTVYGAGRLTRYTLELIVRITPLRLRIFNSRTGALDFLHAMVHQEYEYAAAATAEPAAGAVEEIPAD